MAGEKPFNSCPFIITHDKGDTRHLSEHMGDAFQVARVFFSPKALLRIYCFQGFSEL